MKRKIIRFSTKLVGIYYNISSNIIIDKFLDDLKDEGQTNFLRKDDNSIEVKNDLNLKKKYSGLKLNYFYKIPYYKLSVNDQVENKIKQIDFEVDISKVIIYGLFGIILFVGIALIFPLFSGETPDLKNSAIIISFALFFIAGGIAFGILKIRTLLTENIRELKQEYDNKQSITLNKKH